MKCCRRWLPGESWISRTRSFKSRSKDLETDFTSTRNSLWHLPLPYSLTMTPPTCETYPSVSHEMDAYLDTSWGQSLENLNRLYAHMVFTILFGLHAWEPHGRGWGSKEWIHVLSNLYHTWSGINKIRLPSNPMPNLSDALSEAL